MQLRTSTSMQMIDHKVENLVSAINKPKIQWKNKGKVERMRCSWRQDEKHGKTVKQDFRKLFANSSQPLRISQCVGNQFRIAKSNSPVHCTFAKFASHKTLAKFRIAKIRNVLATLAKFAMPISQCEFRNANFAMRISQCQLQFRNANSNFAMPISQCQFRKANTLFICLT